MNKITEQQFLFRQPSFPEEKSTDKYYLDLANRLLASWNACSILKDVPFSVRQRVCLCIIGYYQDVISDAGLWRTFVDEHRKLYGRTLPFYAVADEYTDYELNAEDVRFLIWYSIAMNYEEMRMLSPFDRGIKDLSERMWQILEEHYDDAPLPDDFHFGRELEIHDPEDAEKLYHLGQWLFLRSYLLTPAFSLTLSGIVADLQSRGENDMDHIKRRLEEAMTTEPTGPLALYTREWMYLMVENKLPPASKGKKCQTSGVHPYYKAVTAEGGSPIRFFKTYQEMNDFFISVLGWDKGEDHLESLKNHEYFAILVNPDKGMLVVADVARCIKHPENKWYDKEFAVEHALELLTVRGKCPGDLVRYLNDGGFLPDVSFAGADNAATVENSDFIARCYLQEYYRGD